VASVAVVPGLAVAVGETTVVGLDPADGHVLWTVDDRKRGPLTTAAIDPGLGANGIMVLTEGDRRGASALVGLDLATRKRLWSLPLGDLVQGSPTVDGGRAFVGARDGFVYAADVATGRLLWKAKTAASVTTTPAASDGRVFVANEDPQTGNVQLIAFDASTGRSRWIFAQPRAAQGQPSSPTVAAGRVYAGFGDLTVRSFDAATGAVVWTTPIRSAFSPRSSLAVVGGSLYALDVIGGLYRIDAATGDRIWDFQFPAFVSWSSPVVAGGFVYAGMDDGVIAAVDADRGHLVWQAGGGGEVGALAPAGDLLLAPVVTGSGGILAFAHDRAGALLDVPSPTELHFPSALASFAGAFLIMTALLLGLFRYVLRSRGEPAASEAEPTEPTGGD
jgi:outer membrane protein assembly factor BamB